MNVDTTTKQTKVPILVAQSGQFLSILREMDEHLHEAWEGNSKMLLPFVVTCAATLECILNEHISLGCNEKFSGHSKDIQDALVSMSLAGKLRFIIPFLTDNQARLNRHHPACHLLVGLISLRNKLMHYKTSFEEVDAEMGVDDNGRGTLNLTLTLKGDHSKIAFGVADHLESTAYVEALTTLNVCLEQLIAGEDVTEGEFVVPARDDSGSLR